MLDASAIYTLTAVFVFALLWGLYLKDWPDGWGFCQMVVVALLWPIVFLYVVGFVFRAVCYIVQRYVTRWKISNNKRKK